MVKTNRKIILALVACLALLGLVTMAIPRSSAQAWFQDSQWSETTYTGYDEYYGDWVNAYEAGATAKLAVQVYNDWGTDFTIKSAKIEFDWGGEYNATSFPSELKAWKLGIINFAFTVPSTDVASNAVLHSYRVKFFFVPQDWSTLVYRDPAQYLGTGNGVNLVFGSLSTPVIPGSVKISLINTVANTVTVADPATYIVNNYSGTVTFGAAPPINTQVYADSKYGDYLFSGDGTQTIGYTDYNPVVVDSVTVCIYDWVAETVTTLAASAYSVDYETGKVTLNTAPLWYQYVYASYTYEEMWDTGDYNFAVYSADQADANAMHTTLDAKYDAFDLTNWYDLPSGTIANLTKSFASYDLGWDAYNSGKFADAKTNFAAALTELQAAIDAYVAYNQALENANVAENEAYVANMTAETALTIAQTANVTKEGAQIDAQTALLQAQAEQAESEAGKADSIGTFYILIGIAGLLVGIGVLVFGLTHLIKKT